MNQVHNIELANPADAQHIATMSRDLIETGLGWRWTPRRVVACIRAPHNNVAIIRDQQTVSAFGIMEYKDDQAHLVLFAVRPMQRRQGLGTQLLQWLEETAVVAEAREVGLEVRTHNASAQAFYRRHGYREVERIKHYYRAGEDALRMRHQLY